jgi:hypothetical protein
MILPSQCMILYSSIIGSLYLMICRISMQNYVQDLFDTIFFRYTCYDTVSTTYDTTLISLIINYGDTSAFCMYGMHDTSYDSTTIVTSLNVKRLPPCTTAGVFSLVCTQIKPRRAWYAIAYSREKKPRRAPLRRRRNCSPARTGMADVYPKSASLRYSTPSARGGALVRRHRHVSDPVGPALSSFCRTNNASLTDLDVSGDCKQMFRIACHVEELGDGVVLRGVGHVGSRR